MLSNLAAQGASSHELDQPPQINSPVQASKKGSEKTSLSTRLKSWLPQSKQEPSQVSGHQVSTASSSGNSKALERESSIPVPDSRTKRIWIFLPVENGEFTTSYYEQKAARVRQHLKRAVDGHRKLQDRSRSINYEMRMVGPTPQAALPSIIVWSRNKDLKHLKSLFNNDFLARIQCRSHFRRPGLPLVSRTALPDKPVFWLFYYYGDSDPTIRKAGQECKIEVFSEWTLSGSLITYDGRQATVGLTLEINDVDYILTVAHLFGDEKNSYSGDTLKSPSKDPYSPKEIIASDSFTDRGDEDVAIDSNSSSDQGDEGDWVYDSDEDGDSWGAVEPNDSDSLGAPPRTTNLSSMETRKDPETPAFAEAVGSEAGDDFGNNAVNPAEPIYGLESDQQGQSSMEQQLSSPFLDWTLLALNMNVQASFRRNFIQVSEIPEQGILLARFVDTPRLKTTPILMSSGIRGTMTGMMVGSKTYLGSPPGQEMCRVWTVVLDPYDGDDADKGLLPGECGSIVVDRETFEVYGHVVASNTLGHAYVVPMAETIQQIRSRPGVKYVNFPLTLRTRPATSYAASYAASSTFSRAQHASTDIPEPESSRAAGRQGSKRGPSTVATSITASSVFSRNQDAMTDITEPEPSRGMERQETKKGPPDLSPKASLSQIPIESALQQHGPDEQQDVRFPSHDIIGSFLADYDAVWAPVGLRAREPRQEHLTAEEFNLLLQEEDAADHPGRNRIS